MMISPAGADRGPLSGPAKPSVLAPTLITFAVVALLFLGYELVERLWLTEADPQLIFRLHRARGAAAALIAAGLAGWFIQRRAAPLLTTSLGGGDGDPGSPLSEHERRLRHAHWLVLVRWIAVLMAFTLVLVASATGMLPEHATVALLACTALLVALNVAYSWYLRRERAGQGFLALQAYGDLLALVLLLHLGGGIDNPLSPLLMLHVMVAAIILGRRHAYGMALTAGVLFAAVAWGEWSGLLAGDTLAALAEHDAAFVAGRVGLKAALLLLVAYFTSTLVERIRGDERRLRGLADQALSQAQILERSLDTTRTALCLFDRSARPFWANRRWNEWLQVAPALASAVEGEGSYVRRTFADGRTRTQDTAVPAPASRGTSDPSYEHGRVFQLTTAPLLDRAGNISHVVALAWEVTEQKLAHERSLRAERLAAVGELAGQVAHEVNNPVAIISAKARLLLRNRRREMQPAAAREVEKIVELADRVARIAQGLLSYCRPAPGSRGPLQPALPLRSALAYVDSRASACGVTLVDELPVDLPEVLANAAELEQVFLNLCLNALDAMPCGGRLTVGAAVLPGAVQGEGGWVELRVEDTGGGIDPAIRERIFEPFLTTKRDGMGSGLGLSICQGLVRSHGGEITLESHRGGTRALIRLPSLTSAGRAAVTSTRELSHA